MRSNDNLRTSLTAIEAIATQAPAVALNDVTPVGEPVATLNIPEFNDPGACGTASRLF